MPQPLSPAHRVTFERLVAQLAPQLAKTDPPAARQLEGALVEVKRSAVLSPTSQQALRRLFLWQLEVKRAACVRELDTLRRVPAAAATARQRRAALEHVIAVLDEAKKAMSSNVVQRVERAADQARESLGALCPKKASLALRKPSSRPPSAYAMPSWLAAKLEPKK